MTCQDRRQAIFLHAAGVLDDAERAELDAHLATGCPRCADARAQAEEELAGLALALDPIAPPARVRERLLARARAESGPAPPDRGTAPPPPHAPDTRSRRRRRRPLAAGLAAGVAAAAALAAGWWTVVRPLEQERDRLAGEKLALELAHEATLAELAAVREEMAEQDDELSQLEARVERSLQEVSLLSARKVDAVELSPREPGSGAWARIFWDEDYRCYFRAQGLPPLEPDRSYVLWAFAPDDAVHPVGELAPDAEGAATLYTRLPRDFRPVVRTIVTSEPTPHGDRPSGPVVLSGGAGR
jgi:hypothetical protein